MAARDVNLLVIHCTGSRNLKAITQSSVDHEHATRKPPFKRKEGWKAMHRPDLIAFGYHYLINVDGIVSEGRHLDEVGAHAAGYNQNSIGICMAGTDEFSQEQWDSLLSLVQELRVTYPAAGICGHRDLSPDANGDGEISRFEWIKTCPGFNVSDWLVSVGLSE